MERNTEQQLDHLAELISRAQASRNGPNFIRFTTAQTTETPNPRQASTGQGGKVSEGKT